MIGEIILSIKSFLKQNMCVHEYKYDGHIDAYGDMFNFEKCTKCGRQKIIK